MVDLNEFVEWSKQNPFSHVEISIGGQDRNDVGKYRVWVFDYTRMVGQHVNCVAEIDLDAAEREDMERKKTELERYFKQQEKVNS